MKICKDTLNILKAFASINPCIYLGDEKAIRVISPSGSVIGVYKTAEALDHKCVFWDWPQLISTINYMGGEEAELDFQEKFVKIISPNKSSLKYFYTNKIVVERDNPEPKPYTAYCKEMETDFSFEIPADTISKILSISKNLNLTKMSIEMEDGKGVIKVFEDGNKVDHNFTEEIEGTGKGNISLWIESLHLIPGSYKVDIKNGLFAKFMHNDIPLFFIVAASKKN